MRKVFLSILFLIAASAISAEQISAQSAAPDNKANTERRAGKRRPNLFQELGVTAEQREQIRDLRKQGRDEFTAAQRKLREANKALDAAIYSDALDEQLVEQLIAERNEAEAALSRLKTMSELSLRKILTPEQVAKFREIRSRFAKREREMRRERPRPGADGDEMPPRPPDGGAPEPEDD